MTGMGITRKVIVRENITPTVIPKKLLMIMSRMTTMKQKTVA